MGQEKQYAGIKALVMGLGLHGGGLESVRYLASRGAEVTVTDLRNEAVLAPSLEKLRSLDGSCAFPVRYVLGRHEIEDFRKADMVIKNPGVPPDSPFLQAARRIETDISLFLAHNPARLTAVTGSKGKSGTASAIHWILQEARKEKTLSGQAYLGGNITYSPLSFADSLHPDDDVVLELSSWQLGDLKGRMKDGEAGGTTDQALLQPRAAVLTAIMPDHLDRYGSMDAYVADKRIIYQGQDRRDVTIADSSAWGQSFLRESRGRPMPYGESPPESDAAGGWFEDPRGPGLARLCGGAPCIEAVPARVLVPGYHQKKNLLAAALCALDLGLPADMVRRAVGSFPGIEHRLEFFHESQGVRFYNDTAATIPEAAEAAVGAFDEAQAPVLVAGGSDKNLDLSPLVRAARKARALVLLAGTGTSRLTALLDEAGVPYRGPFDTLDRAVQAALETARPGDTVILSPGCASFGMFQNEFDRGKKWKEAVRRLA